MEFFLIFFMSFLYRKILEIAFENQKKITLPAKSDRMSGEQQTNCGLVLSREPPLRRTKKLER